VRDIGENLTLITRENVLAARGLEYDFEPIKQRAREKAWEEARTKRSHGSFISRDRWAEAEHWHRIMDRLCGVDEAHRSPGDAPSQTKLDELGRELAVRGRNVQGWVDKFVAHAASPESRQTLERDQQDLSLAKVRLAERVIVRAANFVSHNFLEGTGLGGVPVPEFDQFLHVEKPFVVPSALQAMRQAWERHVVEFRSCEDWFWDGPLADVSDTWGEDGEEG
jgi:hypothetical protein